MLHFVKIDNYDNTKIIEIEKDYIHITLSYIWKLIYLRKLT